MRELEIKRLRYSGGNNQYNSADSNGNWSNINGTVYFCLCAEYGNSWKEVDHTGMELQ